jgi:hypothetical protein
MSTGIQSFSRPSPFNGCFLLAGALWRIKWTSGADMPNPTGRTFSGCSSSSSLSLQSGWFSLSLVFLSICTDQDVVGSVSQDFDAESGTTNAKTALEKRKKKFFEEPVVLRGFSRSLDVLRKRLRINMYCILLWFYPYHRLTDQNSNPAFPSVADKMLTKKVFFKFSC